MRVACAAQAAEPVLHRCLVSLGGLLPENKVDWPKAGVSAFMS